MLHRAKTKKQGTVLKVLGLCILFCHGGSLAADYKITRSYCCHLGVFTIRVACNWKNCYVELLSPCSGWFPEIVSEKPLFSCVVSG